MAKILSAFLIALTTFFSAVGQGRKFPDAALVARWLEANVQSNLYPPPYWGSDFIIVAVDEHQLKDCVRSFKNDSTLGFVYQKLKVGDYFAVLIVGRRITKLVDYYGGINFKYVDTALANKQGPQGTLLLYRYEKTPNETLVRFDSTGHRLQLDSTALFPVTSDFYNLTFFLPDTLRRGKDAFTLFTLHTIRGPATITKHYIELTKGDTVNNKPTTIHITSTPQRCEIFKVDQDVYDLDQIFKNYRSKNFRYDAAFVDNLMQYIVVEGSTNITIPTDETNSIIFIKIGNKLSPPLRCLPVKNQTVNINWNFK